MKLNLWPFKKNSAPEIRNTKREFIEVGSSVRVENGPAQKVGIATVTLLNDKNTASHYQVGALDAMGQRIVLGKPMTYLDYRGPWVWYIYHFDKVTQRWLPAGIEATKEAAMPVAKEMKEK